jgi:peptidoglycan/LPS O-acetylase OafA/YrhL
MNEPGKLISSGQWSELILRVTISAVLCWLLAMLTYRYIETPFLKLKSRLPTRKTKSLAVSKAPVQ